MKFNVYGVMTASIKLGTYEAKDKEEAEKLAGEGPEADWMPGLCIHCSEEIELGEIYENQVEKAE